MDTITDILSTLDTNAPILLVDADEVLLQFIKRLETFFPTKGYELRLDSFKLGGNIYKAEETTPADHTTVKSLISVFFDECADDIPVVPGAQPALSTLSKHYQIIILTNIPAKNKKLRQDSLKDFGINYPLIANKGEKGPAVKLFAEKTNNKTIFIDDLPPNHKSVAHHSPDTHRIHFIADHRLSNLSPKADDAHIRLKDWPAITSYLLDMLEG